MLLVLEKKKKKKNIVYSLRVYSLLKEIYINSYCLGIGLTNIITINCSIISVVTNIDFLILHLDNFNLLIIIKLSVLRIGFKN